MKWIWIFGISGFATLLAVNVVWRFWIQGTLGAILWILCMAVFILSSVMVIVSLTDRVETLENEKQERIDKLTDPSVIDSELERSARRREAFDSNMAYPPREDSGPPAKIRHPAKAPGYRSNGLAFRKRAPFGQNRFKKDS